MKARRIDRTGWVRDIPGQYTTGGYPLTVHLAAQDDTSPIHATYPTGYHPDCGWCWLGAPHSVNAHQAKLS